jgi:hypothetical protein
MRNSVVAAVLVIGLVIGAGLGYGIGSDTNKQTTTTTTFTFTSVVSKTVNQEPTLGTCSSTADLLSLVAGPSTANSSQQGYLSIVMNKDSNATVFVKYCHIGSLTTSIPSGYVTVSPDSPIAPGVTEGAFPDQILSSNATAVVVAFFLTANPTAQGYFYVGVPYSCYDPLLSVGHSEANLNVSSWGNVGVVHPCPTTTLQAEFLGVSGANFTYLSYGKQ